MKLDIATTALASLLLAADPVMVQAARQKKERVMDSEHLEEMEDDTNKHHQRKDDKHGVYKKDDIHYDANSQKKKKEELIGSEQLESGSNNKLVPGSHSNKQQTVSSHKGGSIKNDLKNRETDTTNKSVIDAPDVGILASDTTAALDRNLQRRRKKTRKKGPTSCFTEIPLILRKRGDVVFTQPYCDESSEYGAMTYWDIKDGNTFFYAGKLRCFVYYSSMSRDALF